MSRSAGPWAPVPTTGHRTCPSRGGTGVGCPAGPADSGEARWPRMSMTSDDRRNPIAFWSGGSGLLISCSSPQRLCWDGHVSMRQRTAPVPSPVEPRSSPEAEPSLKAKTCAAVPAYLKPPQPLHRSFDLQRAATCRFDHQEGSIVAGEDIFRTWEHGTQLLGSLDVDLDACHRTPIQLAHEAVQAPRLYGKDAILGPGALEARAPHMSHASLRTSEALPVAIEGGRINHPHPLETVEGHVAVAGAPRAPGAARWRPLARMALPAGRSGA